MSTKFSLERLIVLIIVSLCVLSRPLISHKIPYYYVIDDEFGNKQIVASPQGMGEGERSEQTSRLQELVRLLQNEIDG